MSTKTLVRPIRAASFGVTRVVPSKSVANTPFLPVASTEATSITSQIHELLLNASMKALIENRQRLSDEEYEELMACIVTPYFYTVLMEQLNASLANALEHWNE